MAGETILVADDDQAIRTVLEHALARDGYRVRSAGNVATLWKWVSDGEGDLVITDVVMPDGSGLDLLPQMKKARPDLPIIVMSAQSTLLTAVKANERGAFEYLPKPFDLKELSSVARRALEAARNPSSQSNKGEPEEEGMPLVGRSQSMQEVYRVMARVMATDLTVMITGESGTGKELVARALHDYGKRKNYPFVAVNMAAIPRELIESELFGHEKGAFTGANARSIGRFEQAQGGTLFLDEIGDMPMEAQTRLLRVLQEGEFSTVGGRTAIKADVRIIAATNKDLRVLIDQGLFREDLFYRLNVVPIRIPALRERSDDIPDLSRHFLSRCEDEGLPAKSFSKDALDMMQQYRWPGNVRELENFVRRLIALTAEDIISSNAVRVELAETTTVQRTESVPENESLSEAVERHLRKYFDAHTGELPPPGLYDRVLAEVERPLIELCLDATRGNQVKSAILLGLNRNTLRKKIRDLDIQVVRGRGSDRI